MPRHFDTHARMLIKGLLTIDLTRRLGSSDKGGKEVQSHKWFWGLCFDNLLARTIRPPFVPPVNQEDDTVQVCGR